MKTRIPGGASNHPQLRPGEYMQSVRESLDAASRGENSGIGGER